MVDNALTGALRALARFVMRLVPILPAALCVAIGMPAVTAPAWADSPVILDGADEDSRRAILDLLPDRDEPTTLFEAERIGEEAAARALAWLRSEGYYAATVTPEASEDPPTARLVIELGPRFRFEAPEVIWTGETPEPHADYGVVRALNEVEYGAPARAAPVLSAQANALQALQAAGYANASAGERRVIVDHATARVTAQYRFDIGAITRLGSVSAQPDDLFRPSFVEQLQNWENGERYSPQALQQLRRDLTSTGAVSLATTRLEPPGPDGLSNVVVDVEAARRNAYELGVSYSTTEGFGVVGEWTRRNFTRRADALSIEATLAEMQQGVTVEWLRPHWAGRSHALTLGSELGREKIDAYTRTGAAIYGTVTASNRLRLGQSYGVRLAVDQYDDLVSDVSDAVVLSGFYNVRNDSTGFTLDPRDGSIVDLRVEPSVSAGDATLGFVRLIGEGRIYESFLDNDRLTLAARVLTGWLEPVSGSADDVPPDRRFYAGGGGSVRGYEYNSIYPAERDLLGLTPGGQGLLEGSIEARYRFDNGWGAAVFIDGGTAFDDWGEAGDLSFGAGVGVRYDLGFAPLRIDFAVPLDDSESGDDFAVYISLGQAF
jgi:translocation and assembly module TamA